MRLISLKLGNFQGIEDFTFSPDGKNVRVNGGNGAGKTTLANAFYWLWFDQPFTGEKNYLPKSVDSDGEDVTVEAVVVQDGERTHLKKVFREKKKSNGEFSGHTTECFIDDVPCETLKAFQRVLDNICPKDIALQMASFDYFLAEMPMKDRRGITLKMSGEVSDDEVLASDKKLSRLSEILKGKTTDQYIALAKDNIKKAKRQIESIPAVIVELKAGKPDVEIEKDDAEKEKEVLEEKKAELERKKASYESSAVGELEKQIAEIEAQEERAKNAFISENIERNKPVFEKINRVGAEKSALVTKLALLQANKSEAEKALEKLEEKRRIMLAEWSKVNEWRYNPEAKCITCGQPITESMFNVHKSKELERISASGKAECSVEIIEKQKAKAHEIEQDIKNIQGEIEAKAEEAKALQFSVKDAVFEETEEYKKFECTISALKEQMKDSAGGIGDLLQNVDSELQEVNQKLAEASRTLMQIEEGERTDKRIRELEKQKKELVAEQEEWEHGKYLCELFQGQRARLLEDKVNGMFANIKFRLFDRQVNAVKDDCEALVLNDRGVYVPFKTTNTASKVKAGLEMIQALSNYYGKQMPCFVDGCESVENFPKTDFQQIRLTVKFGQRELQVEEV